MYGKFNLVVSHLAKFIFVSANKVAAESNSLFYTKTLLNHAHIFMDNREITAGVMFWHRKFITFYSFPDLNYENVSDILFPDKVSDLEGFPLYIVFTNKKGSEVSNGNVYSRWSEFVVILSEKLNATLKVHEISNDQTSLENFSSNISKNLFKLYWKGEFDIFIESHRSHQLFQAYGFEEQCFIAPLPKKISIYEYILFLPLDKSCWMMLGLTIGVSALIWRISEGPRSHWNFLFGMFALFVGKYEEIRT